MEQTSRSSLIVTWDDQVADGFTLQLTTDNGVYQFTTSHVTTFTITGVPASSQYELQMQAIFDQRLSLMSDIVIIRSTDDHVDSKLS